MSFIETQFDGHQWQVRTPQLMRYIGQQYVDDFFERGLLRLSSFQAFRELAGNDEERGDCAEGRFQGNVGNMAIASIYGVTAYVLCTCAVENPTMDANFGTEAGFRIVQPLEFAQMVSKKIAEFQGGLQGLCAYRDGKFHQPDEPPVPFDEAAPKESMEVMERAVAAKMIEGMFIKDLRFANQVEYRFIWNSSEPQMKHLTLECPEAVQFCRRLA